LTWRESVKRPSRDARTAAACGVMASDGMGQKNPGLGYMPGAEALDEIAGESTANVVELSGVIKWFDVSKGYGFIVPDNGLPDVRGGHSRHLRPHGDPAPLWVDRAAARADRAGTLWPRSQGADGGRGAARESPARPGRLALRLRVRLASVRSSLFVVVVMRAA